MSPKIDPSNHQPRVAVLLATYNGEAYVDAQIGSIVWQQHVDTVILARDDGSRDRTVDRLRSWRERSEQIRIVEDDLPPGGTAAVNFFRLIAALDPADPFTHVAFADQDDVWFPDKLAKAVRRLGEVGADGYSSNLLAYDAVTFAGWVMRKDGAQRAHDYLFQGASAGCTYVLTRAAALLVRDRMAATDPARWHLLSHDWTAYAIVRSHGLRWVLDGEAHMMYRQHSGNQYGARGGWRGLVSRLTMSRDGWYRNHILWLRQVVSGSAGELRLLDAVERLNQRDRIWLARRASDLRRSPREARLLQLALLGRQI